MEVTHKTVQRILDKYHLGNLERLTKESLGITGSVFCINNRFILKIGGVSSKDKLRVERNALMCELLEKSGIKVPRVVALDTSREILEQKYVLLTRLEGENLATVWGSLPAGEQQSIAREFGTILATIHQIKMGKCGDIIDNLHYGNSWHDFIIGRYRTYFDYLENEPILPAAVLRQVQELFGNNDHIFPNDIQAVLLHVDFQSKNIRYHGGEISGIFDFDECLGGHNEFDFTKVFLPYTIDVRFKEAIIEGYTRIGTLSSEFGRRVRLYSIGAMLNALWFCHSNGLLTPALQQKYSGSLGTLLGEINNQ